MEAGKPDGTDQEECVDREGERAKTEPPRTKPYWDGYIALEEWEHSQTNFSHFFLRVAIPSPDKHLGFFCKCDFSHYTAGRDVRSLFLKACCSYISIR